MARSFAFAGILAIGAAACGSSAPAGSAPTPVTDRSSSAPSPDRRVGLGAGWFTASEAAWNLQLVSSTRPSAQFINPANPGDNRFTNSDITFAGHYAIQGNYSGWQVWDIANPKKPVLYTSYFCPGSQSDVSVYKQLLFVSGESISGRLDCGAQGVADTVSQDRLRGIRIFDISDLKNPRYIANVQTCRGSHTHTVVTDPKDPANVYVYVSGSAGVRSPNELPGCSGASLEEDPNSALFRIEVIRVPLSAPEQAKIVSSPRIFQDLSAPPRHAEPVDSAQLRLRAATDTAIAAARQRGDSVAKVVLDGRTLILRVAAARPGPGAGRRGGPTQCHDITVYPAIGLAGGACGGYGLLLDIRDAANPKRIGAVADSNFSFWHSATFSNDGSKILFTDEWGGGRAPRCRASDKYEWGADAIFTLANNRMTFKSYYKMPAPQTGFENCVAHNGSLIPIPGREVMVQGWYQGGISVFDWTDPGHPREIAYFDRGPMDSTKLVDAGSWSAYWYNGQIYSSEIARGLDVYELLPSAFVSENELAAAKQVRFDFLNAQDQQQFVWAPSFAVSRAYLDQLERSKGLSTELLAGAREELARAERMKGSARKDALTALATRLHAAANSAADQPKAHTLARSVGELANATP